MEGHDSVQPPASHGEWRRPPWSTPSGRRPRFRQVLRTGFGSTPSTWRCVQGCTSGTSRRPGHLRTCGLSNLLRRNSGLGARLRSHGDPHLRATPRSRAAWLGLNVNRAARAWFGLAIVIPLVISGVGAFYFSPPGPTTQSQILFTVFFFAPAGIAAGCILRSRACSCRDIKKSSRLWCCSELRHVKRSLLVVGRSSMGKRSRDSATSGAPVARRQLLVDWARLVALPPFPWRMPKASRAAPDASARGAVG